MLYVARYIRYIIRMCTRGLGLETDTSGSPSEVCVIDELTVSKVFLVTKHPLLMIVYHACCHTPQIHQKYWNNI